MRVGYVQFEPRFGEVKRNIGRAIEMMGSERADLWVLPELFSTGYLFVSREELMGLAEPVPEGPTTQALLDFSCKANATVVAGLAERAGDKVYNAAVIVGPAGLIGRYRKIHLFGKEKLWFDPGDLPLEPMDLGGVKIGVMICFDHFFPEAARTLALRGAQILCHPANLVLPGMGQLSMRVRAMENRVFAVTANRIGGEARGGKELRFTGESQIVSPEGAVLLRASPEGEEVGVVEIDPEKALDKRVTRYNDLFADRRPEFYGASLKMAYRKRWSR